MDMIEFKVPIPEGMEIDKEKSTFECIKFKPIKPKRWRDDEDNTFSGYFIAENTTIHNTIEVFNTDHNYNVFATKKQAKAALAMARISQIMANDERFGGVFTDEEWNDPCKYKFCIFRWSNVISVDCYTHCYNFLSFHTREQRDLFLEENEDLVKDYLMIE